jgi:hypothetical protein
MPKVAPSRKLFRIRTLGIATAALAVVAAGLLTAPTASAVQIWYQSVGRTSQTSPCQVSSVNDIATGWTNWAGSYEQWPNGGRGGWTCTRNLLWANDGIISPIVTGAGCVLADTQAGSYANFGSQNFLAGSAPSYSNASCTNTNAFYIPELVYGTSLAAADAVCAANIPGRNHAATQAWTAPNVYVCVI